jgi:peptidoglycan/LPS O-acetylase OafA/YrhL
MNKNNRIEHIDVWRFFAVFLVVAAHIIKFSHPWYEQHLPGLVWRSMPFGLLGVQLFFCISGFVICRGILKENETTGKVSMRSFYIRRAFRILPPLLLYITVLLLLSVTDIIHVEAKQIAYSLGFVCNVKEIDCGWFLGHTWSLAFEEQFYLLFPVLFLTLGLSVYREKLVKIAVALGVATVIATLTSHEEIAYFLSTFAYMAWGCVFAFYWDKLKPILTNLPFGIWLLAPATLVGVHLIALPIFFHQVIYPVVAPILICIAVFGTPAHHRFMQPIFNNQTLAYLGRISYSIYLWQQIATTHFGFSSPVPALLSIPCVVVIAHFSFRYFEKRMIAIGSTLSVQTINLSAKIGDDPLAPRDDIYRQL